MGRREELLQGRAYRHLTIHHVLGNLHFNVCLHINNDIIYRDESESISAQMTIVDTLMSKLISSIAGQPTSHHSDYNASDSTHSTI